MKIALDTKETIKARLTCVSSILDFAANLEHSLKGEIDISGRNIFALHERINVINQKINHKISPHQWGDLKECTVKPIIPLLVDGSQSEPMPLVGMASS